MAIVASLIYVVSWTSSFSKSNIMGKDAAVGSALTEYNTPAKVCGLFFTIPPLAGPTVATCLDYRF